MKKLHHMIKFSGQKVTNASLDSFSTQNGSVTTTLPIDDAVLFELGYILGYFMTDKISLG